MADALDVADRFFSAIEAGDIETVRALYHPDVEVWHNTDRAVQGRDANLVVLGWMSTNLPGPR